MLIALFNNSELLNMKIENGKYLVFNVKMTFKN